MDPQVKIKILRLYEKNPGVALIYALEEMYSTLSKSKDLKGPKGDKGDSIAPETRKDMLKEIFAYLKENQPADGRTPTTDDLLKIILPLVPAARDGKTPTAKELLPIVRKTTREEMSAAEDRLKSWLQEMILNTPDRLDNVDKDEASEDIIKKINNHEESIDPKTIKGLTTMLAKFQMSLREKGGGEGGGKAGGGMGNWVHERFAVGDAQASVTLKNAPAAGGTAIMLRYQGQMLAEGQEYSVRGNVVSLLFTTVSGNYVDATYVRS